MSRDRHTAAPGDVSSRVERARARVVDARRAARLARIGAADELRARAARRNRRLRTALIGVVVVVGAAVLAAGVLAWQVNSAQGQQRANAEVLAAAEAAAVAMLTADPVDPEGYVDAVTEVSTGRQLERIEGARDDLAAAVAEQPGRSVGQVVTAGLITEPDENDPDQADVLLVADATNPLLFGEAPAAAEVDPTGERLTVVLAMQRADGRWKIAEARRA